MSPITNARHLFNEVPTGYPIPGKTTIYDTTQTIDLENVPLNGGLLIKVLVLSIDPYLRGKMRDANVKSYAPANIIGEPLYNHGVGVVLRSEFPGVKAGDHVYGMLNFQEYDIKKDMFDLRVIENKENLPWSVFTGAAGMPGKTAFAGWKAYSKAKKGETAFITTGAGLVGSLVAQFAKLDGLKVVASAGSDDKVDFMKEMGVDVAFNYKKTDTRAVMEKEGPLDVYWDNVGGEMLEAAIDNAAVKSRFIECGWISGYNGEPQPVRNLHLLFGKSITLYGFLIFAIEHEYIDEFYATVPKMIAEGKLKFKEDITRGLDKVGEAILAVQQGTNTGKSVILVAEE